MAHIVSLSDNYYQRDPALILPAWLVDLEELAAAVERTNYKNSESEKLRLMVDGRVVTDGKRDTWDDVPFGTARWLLLIGSVVAVELLAFFVSLWLLLFILLGPAVLQLHRYWRVCQQRNRDERLLQSVWKHPSAVRLRQPNPVLAWALKLHAFYNYPACDFVLSWDTIEKWDEYRGLSIPKAASFFIRADMGDGNCNIAKVRRSHAAIYNRAVKTARQRAYDDFSLRKWAEDQGVMVFAAAEAILSDPDIAGAYELDQRILQTGSEYGDDTADRDVTASLQQKVAARVQEILEGVNLQRQQELEAESAGAAALAAQLSNS